MNLTNSIQVQKIQANRPLAASSESVPAGLEQLVDQLFEQMAASCPAMDYWSPRKMALTKQQWVLGFAENQIRSFAQIQASMRALHTKEDDFVPSVGKSLAGVKAFLRRNLVCRSCRSCFNGLTATAARWIPIMNLCLKAMRNTG